jgi:LCP family protein required for cell wall assembly
MIFEHLDDPAGFRPDDEFRAAAQREGRRRRRRRRLALSGGSVVASLLVVVMTASGYGLWRVSEIDRVPIEFATEPIDPEQPFNVLLIGSDQRSDPAEQVTGARSDTMIVVRVEPGDRRVVMLSLPRDLVVAPDQVALPEQYVGTERLNAALSNGGPSELVRIVETDLGIPLSAYVEVGFDGLVRLVDEVGGLPLSISATVRDRATGLLLEPSACTEVDGPDALALVRSRHLEHREADGRWVTDPTGDLGRMARQRAVLASLLPRLGDLADSLGGIETSLDVLADHVVIDDRLDVGTLLGLARWATDGPPPSLEEVALPVVATMIQEASVLVLGAGAEQAVSRVGGSFPGSVPSLAELPAGDPLPTSSIVEGSTVPVGPCR